MAEKISRSDVKTSDSLSLSLEWIRSNLGTFTPQAAVFPGGFADNLKHCSELALTLNLLRRDAIRLDVINECLEFLWRQSFSDGTLLRDLLVVRPDMLMAMSTYSNFHECGFSCQDVLLLAAKSSHMPWTSLLPLPAWRIFDILNGFARLGLKEFPNKARERSWISAAPPPAIISIDIAYAITHEIFYLTDFGSVIGRFAPEDLSYLRMALPLWKAYFRSLNDIDICAELALSEWYALRSIDPEMVRFCLDQQDTDGTFPGPQRILTNVITPDDGLNRFRTTYHSTLVMVILMSIGLSKDNEANGI